MTARFYSSAIFIALLYSVLATFQNFLFAQIGYQVYTLDSFPMWFLILGAVFFLLWFVVLKYYRTKNYNAVFRVALAAAAIMFVYYVFIYASIMAWVSRAQTYGLFVATVYIVHTAMLIYTATLAFSRSGERPWLKVMGISMFVYGCILIGCMVLASTYPEATQKVQQSVTWFEGVWPLLLVCNFVSEKRTRPHAQASPGRISSGAWITALGGVAAVSAIIVAPKITVEKNDMARWVNRPRELSMAYAEPFEARTFVNDKGKSVQFRFVRPSDYDSTKRYPLVLCLHGGAGSGTGNYEQIEGSWGALMLMEDENRKNFPAFILVPQCPPGSSWGGISALNAIDSVTFDLVEAFEKEFPVDVTRRYIIGESLGGYGTWHFISSRPEIFAAAIPICGEGDPALAPRVAQVAVWAFHGAKDRSVPVSGSRDMIEAMREAGGKPLYSEFEDGGHIIKDQITHTPGVFEWLFAQRK